jgi:hypothetical protein
LRHLGAVWPRALAFPELVRAAGEIVARDGDAETLGAQPVEALALTLLAAARANMLHLHAEPPAANDAAGERPLASAFARRQAAASPIVTNLRHTTIRLDGALHPFLPLLDGQRSVAELAPELERLLAEQARQDPAAEFSPAPSQAVAMARTQQALAALARMGLILK